MPAANARSDCAAIIVAAGRGLRFGGDRPKQFIDLAGEAVLARAVDVFLGHPRVDRVLVVVNEADRDLAMASLGGRRPRLEPPVAGGATRQASVFAGLKALETAPPDVVLIHDAARPLCPPGVVDRVLDALGEADGAIPALPLTETIKRSADGCRIDATLPRSELFAAQTPQGFIYRIILEAHRRAAAEIRADFTDDASIAEWAGCEVRLVKGDPVNLKITTRHDLVIATRRLDGEMLDRAMTQTVPCTGFGYDVHALVEGKKLVLGGVSIEHSHGLEGHSDADVALHAVTDALFGALADGDIGMHFPPSDPQWRGAPSHIFLREAADRVRKRRGRIVHLDLTIVCEIPKIGPHREAIRAKIAEIIGAPKRTISVKATTTERLGFTGRKEGIAACAVATVLLPIEEIEETCV